MTLTNPGTKNKLPEFKNVAEFLAKYAQALQEAVTKIPQESLEAVVKTLVDAKQNGRTVFVAGNGGSAAIADHLCCDFTKGTYVPLKPSMRTHSLTANSAFLTALANDYSYDTVFSRQVEMLMNKGDVLFLISSSGNSPNIVKAAEAAKAKGIKTIGFCGFSGGKLKEISDICLHINVDNYGISEDGHQMLMHVFSQYILHTQN